jgi:hypothetical protein
MLAGAGAVHAADAAPRYAEMAALDQYLMPREQEITLARSAAPTSISGSAEVWVLTPGGYVSVAAGTNGFTCLVERGWSASVDDPDFWNPRLRAPICFNAAASRYLLPLLKLRTGAVIETRSKTKLSERVKGALQRNELPELGAGAMCFMMSRDGYLSEQGGHWHPHLMFFQRHTTPAAWGANATGSAVIAFSDPLDDVTTFLVPVPHWSDGTSETAH